MRFTLRTLLMTGLIAAATCWAGLQMIPRRGAELDRKYVPMNSACPLGELPKNATNVYYNYGGLRNPNTLYQFDINRTDFENWIKAQKRFTSTDYRSIICSGRGSGLYEWILGPDDLSYQWVDKNDGDHGEKIAYDVQHGRCYYCYHLF